MKLFLLSCRYLFIKSLKLELVAAGKTNFCMKWKFSLIRVLELREKVKSSVMVNLKIEGQEQWNFNPYAFKKMFYASSNSGSVGGCVLL